MRINKTCMYDVYYSSFFEVLFSKELKEESRCIKLRLKDSKNKVLKIRGNGKIDDFDLSVLNAVHSFYSYQGNGGTFDCRDIYKMITGNPKAQITKNAKKESTISEEIIHMSLIKLNLCHIQVDNDEFVPLVSIRKIDTSYQIIEVPLIIKLFESSALPISRKKYKISDVKFVTNRGVHYTYNTLSFKSKVLNLLTTGSKDHEIKINLNDIKELIGVSAKLLKWGAELEQEQISYDIYRKRRSKLLREFKEYYVEGYMTFLKKSKLIKSYKREANVLLIKLYK